MPPTSIEWDEYQTIPLLFVSYNAFHFLERIAFFLFLIELQKLLKALPYLKRMIYKDACVSFNFNYPSLMTSLSITVNYSRIRVFRTFNIVQGKGKLVGELEVKL